MSKEEILDKLMPVDYALKDYPEIVLDKSYLKQATNGMTMHIDKCHFDKLIRVYVEDDFIGLGKTHKDNDKYFLKMEKVFYEK